MKVKLKTIEQLRMEFKPIVSEWNETSSSIRIEFFNPHMVWYINSDMLRLLGKVVEMRKLTDVNYQSSSITKRAYEDKWYTHSNGTYVYHELWFDDEYSNFITMEDMEL